MIRIIITMLFPTTYLISFYSLHVLSGREAVPQNTTQSFYRRIQHFHVICHSNEAKQRRRTANTTDQLGHRPGEERPDTLKGKRRQYIWSKKNGQKSDDRAENNARKNTPEIPTMTPPRHLEGPWRWLAVLYTKRTGVVLSRFERPSCNKKWKQT